MDKHESNYSSFISDGLGINLAYIEKHTAEELCVTEEERLLLVKHFGEIEKKIVAQREADANDK